MVAGATPSCSAACLTLKTIMALPPYSTLHVCWTVVMPCSYNASTRSRPAADWGNPFELTLPRPFYFIIACLRFDDKASFFWRISDGPEGLGGGAAETRG